MRRIGVALTLVAGFWHGNAAAVPISVPDIERVVKAAREICPEAMRATGGAGAFVVAQADARGFGQEERVLLLSHCALYAEGFVEGRRSR